MNTAMVITSCMIFNCPSDKRSTFPTYFPNNYSPNSRTTSFMPGYQDVAGIINQPKNTMLKNPSAKIFIADASEIAPAAVLNASTTYVTKPEFLRHNRGANNLYFDGHVKWNQATFYLEQAALLPGGVADQVKCVWIPYK